MQELWVCGGGRGGAVRYNMALVLRLVPRVFLLFSGLTFADTTHALLGPCPYIAQLEQTVREATQSNATFTSIRSGPPVYPR